MPDYRDKEARELRVLFCFGVSQSFFDQSAEDVLEVVDAIKRGFEDLRQRFGVTVLGTIDDDELTVGPSSAWPWTAYILADAPDLDSVAGICNLLRETEVRGDRLWKFMRVEARVGRPLFFGTN
jgi:hypothetical protein